VVSAGGRWKPAQLRRRKSPPATPDSFSRSRLAPGVWSPSTNPSHPGSARTASPPTSGRSCSPRTACRPAADVHVRPTRPGRDLRTARARPARPPGNLAEPMGGGHRRLELASYPVRGEHRRRDWPSAISRGPPSLIGSLTCESEAPVRGASRRPPGTRVSTSRLSAILGLPQPMGLKDSVSRKGRIYNPVGVGDVAMPRPRTALRLSWASELNPVGVPE
jgi:hypothetical protein